MSPKLTLGDTVDLTGVKIRAFDDAALALAREGYCTLLTVPEFCKIEGTPVLPDNYKLKIVRTAEGGFALTMKVCNGMQMIVR